MRQLYVRRGSRMTNAQQRAYAQLHQYAFDTEDKATIQEVLSSSQKTLLEIGFGNGEVIGQFATEHADWTCLGVEVYRPGIGALIRRCQSESLTNVQIAETDAMALLEAMPDSCLDLIFVFFPDPWPKRKHHRRRLVDDEFAGEIERTLKPNASIRLATDWEHYGIQMQSVLDSNLRLQGGRVARYSGRPKTRFEEKGERLGHSVWDFCYKRVE